MYESRKILIIARYTFIEIYKSRIFLNIIMLGIALVGICYIASEMTYGVPARIVLDFGFGITSLASVAISIFMGSGLIFNELEKRTVYMILSRPVSRHVFLMGKVFGMSLILIINILLLGISTIFLYWIFDGEVSGLLFWNLFFTFLESVLMLFIVVFFINFFILGF